MSKVLKLADGNEVPTLGLGTYQSQPLEVKKAVLWALEAGYRHIDCAHYYDNEHEIGAALKEAIDSGLVKRSDVFITAKLWNSFHSKPKVLEGLKISLEKLGTDYIDLYLVHWPVAFKEGGDDVPLDENGKIEMVDIDFVETWQGMEDLKEAGLVKSIGVSNFNASQIDRLLANCRIKPVMNQVEIHPLLTQEKLIKHCRDRGIELTAYCPLGSARRNWGKDGEKAPLELTVDPIAEKYGKSSSQVLLRWGLQRGYVVIPKSVTKTRIEDNLKVYDFELTESEMEAISNLNQNHRFVPVPDYNHHKEYPFAAEY